jgi:hypothetical protein
VGFSRCPRQVRALRDLRVGQSADAARQHLAFTGGEQGQPLGVARPVRDGGNHEVRVGVLAGAAVTYGLACQRGWQPLIPGIAVWAGLAAAAGIGAVAGLYPVLRAARLSPTEALRAS